MMPVSFPEAKVTAAKDQPEYLPLPIAMSSGVEGYVCSCWKLTFWERIKILFTGRVWLEVMTFHRGIPPVRPAIHKPDFSLYGYEE